MSERVGFKEQELDQFANPCKQPFVSTLFCCFPSLCTYLTISLFPSLPLPPSLSPSLPPLAGVKCGTVTSGTMAPCLKSAVSMAYVDSAHAALGTKLKAIVRGKPVDATVVKMPFVPNRYYKKP
jgi:glycine cleavage system aminomethyltransferase T